MMRLLEIRWIRAANLILFVAAIPLLVACQSGGTIAAGGRLYDKWWAETGVDAPESDQPLWATQSSNERNGDTTWRCKECHGWDYRGSEGAYSSGSHFTGFVGVLQAKDKSDSDLVAILSGATNPDHDFSTFLSDSQLKALATFIREGTLDMRVYIGDDGSVSGDPARGKRLYGNGCIACHGSGGDEMNTDDPNDEAVVLGSVANKNPWEVFHKTMYGQPGVSKMLFGQKLGWSQQDVADIVAFLQTLPTD